MINSSFPNTMKKLIQQTVNAECPSDFILGKVTSEKPLLIRLDEQVVLIRQKGGQLFYVANRVFDHIDVHGQWV